MAKRASFTEADTQAITNAYQTALTDYANSLGTLSVSDMLMQFNGSKSELAQALSGTADKKSTAYRTQYKNIDRWLKGERNPARSRVTQNKFKSLYIQKSPPSNIDISITGWVGYDDKYYHRTINTSIPGRGVNPGQFMQAMQAGNTRAAYNAAFSAYGVGSGVLTVASDSAQVHINFS